MSILEKHNPSWVKLYNQEAEKIKSILGNDVIDIQHIGSTAIKGITAKPIIDIAVLMPIIKNKKGMANILAQAGYAYFPSDSSVERMFFRKGDPVQFHLSLTEKGVTDYWQRQIAFRDYLNTHPQKAKEYESLKKELIKEDPSAGEIYSKGKDYFVKEVIKLSKLR